MAETAETEAVTPAAVAVDMGHSKYVNMAAKDMAQVVLADSQVQKGFA